MTGTRPAVPWRTVACGSDTGASLRTQLPDDLLQIDHDVELVDAPAGRDVTVTVRVTARAEVSGVVILDIDLGRPFGVAVYDEGVVQRFGDAHRWVAPDAALLTSYAMSAHDSRVVQLDEAASSVTISRWSPRSFTLSVVVAGAIVDRSRRVSEGFWDPVERVRPTSLQPGETREVVLRILDASEPAPRLFEDAVDYSDPRDLRAHRLALWASEVPCLGSLEHRGSTYPTSYAPERAYGTLHTFFDPDAWSASTALAFSGVPFLQREARMIVERSVGGIRPDGLVPHHFDGEEPLYLAISGSPQPGPNMFLIEAAIEIACATGDLEWFTNIWTGGLRRAAEWLLQQRDSDTGLLRVTGALWADTFRRAGITLDTNAMALRTFRRAAGAARIAGDDISDRLATAADAVKAGFGALWAVSDDHFVTSIAPDGTVLDDHVDTENYLAIATGGATAEQAGRIVELFDNHPLTHPGGRGTYVSLRPYTAADCYGGNVGDSDIAMGRLWWADLLARRAMGDAAAFRALFEPVRGDLLDRVWLRERYAEDGSLVRPDGYHEYPDLADNLLREGMCGLDLDLTSVAITPMRDEPFHARWGTIAISHSPERVSLSLADDLTRSVRVAGLVPGARYTLIGAESRELEANRDGVATFSMSRSFVVERSDC